ncbi:MAG: hypothetical protein IKF19_05675 [Bacilli bacterium]|nr:hypothetical protein [Bacilli bacterium]
MKIIYILSITLLIASFLILKKSNKKKNILSSIIYSICFLFPYQTTIVYISGLFNLGGSLLYYSILNIIISLLLLIPTINKKQIQKYYFDKKEIFLYLSLVLIIFIIVFIRFRGFTIITYMSDDSSIHYKMTTHFKRELTYLNKTNSKDLLYHEFSKTMPASYINGGFFLKLFDNIKPYKAFIIYDMVCLILSSLLFLSTILTLYKKKIDRYLPFFIITVLYIITFPLNNLLYGFFYLGIGIMIINLIFITIKDTETNLTKNLYFNLIILFILNLSLFFSYYLFVPNFYLTTGILYIIQYKNKKISSNIFLKYGIITLIIPFIIGFTHFILPSFFNKSGTVFKIITLYGSIYNNLTPLYLYIIFLVYLGYKAYSKRLNIKDFTSLNIYIISLYCLIFLILFILRISNIYYFYKLFYLFSLFIAIYLSKTIIKNRKKLYIASSIIIILILIPPICGKSIITKFISKTNIYSYNSNEIFNPEIRFKKEELDIVEHVIKSKKACSFNHEIPIITNTHKKFWYYAITNTFPTVGHNDIGRHQLDVPSIKFDWWERNANHPCIVYFYEGKDFKYSKDKFKVLYENKSGVILKKISKNN